MKKKFRAIDSIAKQTAFAAATLLALQPLAGVLMIGLESVAMANAELDRQFALQTLGVLRSYDNVDGLFADYVSVAYKEYFSKQSRFVLQDLSKAEALLVTSKLPYPKLIDDVEVLGQIARTTRAESILRTKIYKEGPQYRFVIDWMHSPRMELLASDTFTLAEPASGQAFGLPEIKAALQSALERLLAKVPFQGTVTGRDGGSVTVGLGVNPGIKRGDELRVGTLEEVKKHPLLKTVVDWRLSSTGKLIVEQVEDAIAFCRVAEEEPGRRIAKYQKIVQWISVSAETQVKDSIIDEDSEKEAERERQMRESPRLGWASVGLWTGGLSRSYSQSTGGVGRDGSGLLMGTRFEGQLWLDREWFGELSLGIGTSSISLTDTATGTPVASPSFSTTLTGFKLAGGFTFFASPDFFGPRGWIKLGYQSFKFSQPIDTTNFTSPTTFSGLFLGFGGDLPLRNDFGGLLTLDFGFLTKGEQTGLSLKTVNGSSAVSFFLGGYKQFSPRLRVRAGLDATLTGADFSANSGTNVTQRAIAFVPSLVYLF